jgi:hypothetical protein
VLALALPGLWLVLRRQGLRRAFVVAALLAAVLLTAASWRMWWGGFTPPARFLVPVAPLLALAAAHAIAERLTARVALLAGWTLLTGFSGLVEPRLVHRDRDGSAPLFRHVSGAVEWTRLLPAYVLPDSDPARHRLALLWALGLALAAWPVRLRGRHPGAWGLGWATTGAVALSVLAARAGPGHADGREALGTLGRAAVAVPGWAVARSTGWQPSDLGWDGLYEPHRNPGGRLLGGRLELPPETYELRMQVQPLPGFGQPSLALRPEPGGAPEVSLPVSCGPAACVARFTCPPGQRAVSLFLSGGGPLLVERLQLSVAQP